MPKPRNGPQEVPDIHDATLGELLRTTERESTTRPSPEALHAYLTGTATSDERAEVQEALASSAGFRREYLELSKEFDDLPWKTVAPSHRWVHLAYAAGLAGLLIVNGLQYATSTGVTPEHALPIPTLASVSAVVIRVPEDSSYVLLRYTPYEISKDVTYETEIQRDRQVVWSTRVFGANVRRSGEGSSVVFAVPAMSLPPGHYKFFFRKVGEELGMPSEFETVR